tara:strand:- start:966 stop:1244 length:279 start_codon:yes stop_codon:yes gene_type:complete
MENVVFLHPKDCPCCWKTDIEEYCEGYKKAEPFSEKKVHFGYLLCQIITNEDIPMDLRRKAGDAIYQYSDYRAALDHIYAPERLQPKNMKEK